MRNASDRHFSGRDRIKGEFLGHCSEPGEAKNCRHPEAAKPRNVDSSCAADGRRIQIDVRGLTKIALSQIDSPEPRGDQRMQRGD